VEQASPREKAKAIEKMMDSKIIKTQITTYYTIDEEDPDVKRLIKKGKIKLSHQDKYGFLENGMVRKL